MDENVTSLKRHKETKGLTALLRRRETPGGEGNNLAWHLKRLYKEDLIGRSEYMAVRAKIIMGQYIRKLRRLSPDLNCGFHLYEIQAGRIWNASVASLPKAFNDYSHGLHVKSDIPLFSNEPEYTRRVVAIENVERSDHLVALNHKQQCLRNGIQAFLTVPIRYNGQPVGYQTIVCGMPRRFHPNEIAALISWTRFLEGELGSVNTFMIEQLRCQAESDPGDPIC